MIYIYKEFIKNNIYLLTKDHIKEFALKQNEYLTNEELNIIYNYIKKYYLELLNKNTTSFNLLRSNIRPDLYNKILNLYNKYINYI